MGVQNQWQHGWPGRFGAIAARAGSIYPRASAALARSDFSHHQAWRAVGQFATTDLSTRMGVPARCEVLFPAAGLISSPRVSFLGTFSNLVRSVRTPATRAQCAPAFRARAPARRVTPDRGSNGMRESARATDRRIADKGHRSENAHRRSMNTRWRSNPWSPKKVTRISGSRTDSSCLSTRIGHERLRPIARTPARSLQNRLV